MCGICGIITLDNTLVGEEPIREMMKIQKHRGPDDEGVFVEENVGLGFVRLSILDLTPAGHQPMFSDDKRYVVVFNDEIFNYIELRAELIIKGYKFNTGTDTEVLLAAYQHWGKDCLHHFNGMWAFVIFDRQLKKIFASRDRYGIKPFYYYQTEEFIAFASEIPPLLSIVKGKPNADYQSIFDYLVYNRTDQSERTFFSEIKKLQHGKSITIQNFDFKIEEWYNLRENVSKSAGFDDSSEFLKLFKDAIKLRLRSDVPVGVCLSGGLDSSSIVSVLLHDLGKSDLNTFSAVYNKGQIGDETEYIKEYEGSVRNMFFTTPNACSLKSDLLEFIKAHGEPIPGTSPYAQFKVMRLAKENVVVTLDGQGADEELAGYDYFFGLYFKDLLSHGRIGKFFYEVFHYLSNHKSFFGIESLVFFLLPEYLRVKARVNEKGYLNVDFVNRFKNNNIIAGNLYGSKSLKDALIDHFEYKLEHLLKSEDRNSMWFSLESRMPFLDYRLVERTLATTGDLKIKKGMTKFILREAMKGILPEKIRLRKDKIGFGTPQDEWFREPIWQEVITEVLSSESLKARKLVNTEAVNELYQKHLSGKVNLSKEIWKCVHLELWFREFID